MVPTIDYKLDVWADSYYVRVRAWINGAYINLEGHPGSDISTKIIGMLAVQCCVDYRFDAQAAAGLMYKFNGKPYTIIPLRPDASAEDVIRFFDVTTVMLSARDAEFAATHQYYASDGARWAARRARNRKADAKETA